jgi:hypothetical protein
MVVSGKYGSASLTPHAFTPNGAGVESYRGRLLVSESDRFTEQQHGAVPGVGFRVEDKQAVDGAGLPVGKDDGTTHLNVRPATVRPLTLALQQPKLLVT